MRAPRYSPQMQKLDSICDGREFLSVDQVATSTGCTADAIRQAVHRGQLCPAKIGLQLVFTRLDVVRWRKHSEEHAIAAELTRGLHPIDVFLAAGGAWSLEQVTRVMLRWARLTGAWIVEAPRGSYARWLERYGLTSLPPRAMRRLVESMLVDEYVRRLVLRGLTTDAVTAVSAAESSDASAGDGLASAATPASALAGE